MSIYVWFNFNDDYNVDHLIILLMVIIVFMITDFSVSSLTKTIVIV